MQKKPDHKATRNGTLVHEDFENIRFMLDLVNPKNPYYRVRHLDPYGDSTVVEFVVPRPFQDPDITLINSFAPHIMGPYKNHREALQRDSEKRGLPPFDLEVPKYP